MTRHTVRRFDADLEQARSGMLAMGGFVERQLRRALLALLAGDARLAEETAAGDPPIDRMEVDIDEACRQVLATRTPAACDLRLVIAIMKGVTDLERVGDETQKIAWIAVGQPAADAPGAFRIVRGLGERAVQMLHGVLDAFARLDGEAALAICREDWALDADYRALHGACIQAMVEDPRRIRWALDVLAVARALERIGDHAKNVGEYAVYAACGADVRHVDPAKAEAALRAGRRPDPSP